MPLLKSNWIELRAILYGAWSVINRHKVRTLVIVGMCAFVVWALMNPPPVETIQQTQAREDALNSQAQTQAAAAERRRQYCRDASICEKYSTSRQECASAGNFDTCMSVKMGDDLGVAGQCTNDGALQYPPTDMTKAELWFCSTFGNLPP